MKSGIPNILTRKIFNIKMSDILVMNGMRECLITISKLLLNELLEMLKTLLFHQQKRENI